MKTQYLKKSKQNHTDFLVKMFGKFTEIESNRETFHLIEMSQSLVFNDLNFIHVVFKSGKKW